MRRFLAVFKERIDVEKAISWVLQQKKKSGNGSVSSGGSKRECGEEVERTEYLEEDIAARKEAVMRILKKVGSLRILGMFPWMCHRLFMHQIHRYGYRFLDSFG